MNHKCKENFQKFVIVTVKAGWWGWSKVRIGNFHSFFSLFFDGFPSTGTGGGRWSRLWSVTARQREDTPASEMSTRYSHVRSDV